MLPTEDSGARTTDVPNARPSRFKRWAAVRARQVRRVFLVAAGVFVVAAVGVMLWRGLCIITLPDVGDPPGIESGGVPPERDALYYFRQASSALKKKPDLARNVELMGPAVGWTKADPMLRDWVDANREALKGLLVAAEQPDGDAYPQAEESCFLNYRVYLGDFVCLALLEGSRLEERGDMPAAWALYRAVLRMRAHILKRGGVFDRFIGYHSCKHLRQRIVQWAADPRTRTADLRRALDDVVACRPRPEWEASSLMVDYRLAMRELNRENGYVEQGDDGDRDYRLAGEPLPPYLAMNIYAFRRFVFREPERSRRVLRLAYANWIAHVQAPDKRRKPPVVRALFRTGQLKTVLYFYDAGPTAPPASRALTPQKLAEWLVTAPDAKLILSNWQWPAIRGQELREFGTLLIELAEQLYQRDNGHAPPSERDLVGPYLKEPPDDGASDLDDGTALIVEEPGSAATPVVPQ